MTTRITVKNEIGRPKNPHDKYVYGSGALSQAWAYFEKSIIPHDAPGIPDTKEGEFVEAELVWQVKNRLGWIDTDDHKYMEGEGFITRQIYRLPQQPKEQEKEKTAEDILDQLGGSYFNGIAKSTIIKAMESYATQQTTTLQATLNDQCAAYDKLVEELDNRVVAKDTRISELEARVKELEGALRGVLAIKSKIDYPMGMNMSHPKYWIERQIVADAFEIATNALKVNNDENV